MMFVYSFLLSAAVAVSAPWWLVRMLRQRRYREGLPERLGRVPARVRKAVAGSQVVWFHAVSVGEVLAASQLVVDFERRLNAEMRPGSWRVVVSTTTLTGQMLARERFGADAVFWFPLDFAWTVRSWLRALEPKLVVLVESEVWPRLLAECARREIPVAVANARMSDRSFKRAVRARRLWSRVLRGVTMFLAQSTETAERLRQLGVSVGSIQVPGNLKYDVEPRETEMVRVLRPLLERRSLAVAGSLLAPEERMLLEAWPAVCDAGVDALLLLAPRHPERFDEVAKEARSGPQAFYRASELMRRRLEGKPVAHLEPHAVLLLDTIGDLAGVYALADVAFVGGSLVAKGGHNPLEPARFGVPVMMGPSYQNFREIVGELQAADAIEIVRNREELASSLTRLLRNRMAADGLGQRGMQVFAYRRGATRRTVEALLALVAGVPARKGPEVRA